MKRTPLIQTIQVLAEPTHEFPTSTETRPVHEGDLHYDVADGSIYRSMYDNPVSPSDWRRVKDVDELSDDEFDALRSAGVIP